MRGSAPCAGLVTVSLLLQGSGGFLGPFSSHRLAVAELIQYCMEFKGSSGNALLSLCSASSRSLVYDSMFPAPARYLFFVLVATRIFTDSFIIISLDSCLERVVYQKKKCCFKNTHDLRPKVAIVR